MDNRIKKYLHLTYVPIYNSINERYHIGSVIGKGSFGQVHLGTPTSSTLYDFPELGVAGSVVSFKTRKFVDLFVQLKNDQILISCNILL